MRSPLRRRRPRLRAALTAEDCSLFAFLLRHFPHATGRGLPDEDDRPDLETTLERCKAGSVPLDRLNEYLRAELALSSDSNPPTLVALKSMKDRLDEGVKRFRQARRLLSSMPIPLGSQAGKAHPEALLEILEAVEGELPKAQELARQMLAGRTRLEAKHGARATGRKRQARLDYASLGIPRDDVRELRQAVRYVARRAPLRFGAGVTLTRVPDDRCVACGNPASRLFRRGEQLPPKTPPCI